MPSSPSPDRAGRALLLTGHPQLLDDLLRLAAAAGVEPAVCSDAGAARSSWLTAPLAVVGTDMADEVARLGLGRRNDVVLVGHDPEGGGDPEGGREPGRNDSLVWAQAVAVGAQNVVFLPAAERWLASRLADAVESRGSPALTVSVLGGRGGAGATTLAAALAVTGMRARRHSMLIDGDPLGGGIDLVLGGEDSTGLRWPQLAGTQGRVSAGALRDALPRVDGLTVLSWDRGDRLTVPPGAMDAVLGAARRGADLVVVDLPRRLDDAAELALSRSDVALLVVPAEVRATAAAARVAAAADLRLVVRGPAPSGLSADVVADALGLPLAGSMRSEPGLAAALERGEPPARRGRGPLAEFCRAFLTAAGHAGVAAA